MMYDICVIGSGAGAGPVIYELSKAGYKVVVLEIDIDSGAFTGPFLSKNGFLRNNRFFLLAGRFNFLGVICFLFFLKVILIYVSGIFFDLFDLT